MKRYFLQAALFAFVAVLALVQPLGDKRAHACSSQPFLGGMCIFGGNFAIRGWALAQGQLLAISSNSALFSLLGTTYGGDGRTTFGLPDLRGRVPIGIGQGPGLSNYGWGQRGGVETVTLTTAQIPSHSHTATLRANGSDGTAQGPSGAVLAANCCDRTYGTVAPDVDMNSGSIVVGNIGGGQAHENRPPYIALYFLIATQGVFPSRS